MSARVAPQRPLVVIVGATGTGKSELAVKLALQFNGEVINADAMQLYKGLPIITNKIGLEEQKDVPHHLLGTIGLEDPTWTVNQFSTKALGIIDDIHQRGKLPIVVGGTHYYTQSLLFNESLPSEDQVGDGEYLTSHEMSQKWPILDQPTDKILEELRKIDPVMADRWHPNDRRKIQRSLEIWLRTGRSASELYAEQAVARNMSANVPSDVSTGAGHGLRYPTLVLWVHADREVLYGRLDARVDKMQFSGLFSEVKRMSTFARKQASKIDHSSGIWVSIGYKEFAEYLRVLDGGGDLDTLEIYKREGLEKMKSATRQYSRRQSQWIRIKLIHALQGYGATNNLFLLNGTQPLGRAENVDAPAAELVDLFLQGSELPDPKSLSPVAAEFLTPKRDYDMSLRRDLWERRVCAVCSVTIVTESDWKSHIQSKRHKAMEKKRAKQMQSVNIESGQTKFSEPADV